MCPLVYADPEPDAAVSPTLPALLLSYSSPVEWTLTPSTSIVGPSSSPPLPRCSAVDRLTSPDLSINPDVVRSASNRRTSHVSHASKVHVGMWTLAARCLTNVTSPSVDSMDRRLRPIDADNSATYIFVNPPFLPTTWMYCRCFLTENTLNGEGVDHERSCYSLDTDGSSVQHLGANPSRKLSSELGQALCGKHDVHHSCFGDTVRCTRLSYLLELLALSLIHISEPTRPY